MKKIFLVITMAIMIFSLSFGATYDDQTVDVQERAGKINYYNALTMADTASATIYYTQWFFIGGSNYEYAYGKFQMNEVGAEDVNVFIEYSDDWATGLIGATDSDLDAVGATIVYDTIGIAQGTVDPYNRFMWARFKFVLGATNGGDGIAVIFSWSSTWIKPANSGVFNKRISLVKDDE